MSGMPCWYEPSRLVDIQSDKYSPVILCGQRSDEISEPGLISSSCIPSMSDRGLCLENNESLALFQVSLVNTTLVCAG